MRNFAAAMRSKTLIFLFLTAVMFVMAGTGMPFFSIQKRGVGVNDTIADAIATAADTSVTAALAALRDSSDVAMTADSLSATAAVDTTKLDSLQLAIYHHNKQIDDSIRLDSINRRRSNGINSPVVYSADDSLVYVATSRRAHLYGNSTVKYENMNLESERIAMSMDSSLVHATGVRDTSDHTGKALVGTPVFKMGNDEYESDTMAFNFKTKKGLINNVYTKQEDGYLSSQLSKRNSNGGYVIDFIAF